MTDRDDPCLHAMQSRCPTCDKEMWAMSVFAFSHGETICARCRKRSRPMTTSEYLAALAATRLNRTTGSPTSPPATSPATPATQSAPHAPPTTNNTAHASRTGGHGGGSATGLP